MIRWTKEQIRMIKEEYIMKGDEALSSIMGKSPNAIRIMACRMGISKLKIRENIKLNSSEEEQVLLGTLMGDSYCRIKKTSKNAVLEGAHCKEQEGYLLWKINKLNSLSFNLRRTKTNYLFFESRSFPCLNHYHDLFYKSGKKKINLQILEKIDALGLAVWYMDDGSYGKRDCNSSLHTNGFTYEENTLIMDWFKERWGFSPRITRVKDEERYPGKVWYYLRFNISETKKLIEIIKPYVHPSLKYKIGG